MARYKPYPYAQGTLIPSHFAKQIRPGAFGYPPNHLLDHALALFDSRCRVPKGIFLLY